jgi:hypothetical protein
MDIASIDDVKYELVAKNNNTIIRGPSVSFTPDTLVNPLDDLTQTISWKTVLNEDDYIENDTLECEPNSRCGLKHFFEMWSGDDTWPHFEEGWVMQASMMVTATITIKEKDKNGNEITYVHPNNETYILSNEVPITQEIFKYFVGWDLVSLKNRQKIDDMKITNYTLVNKIVNEIVQLERPDKSKSNIIQPVFFRSVDSEFITIHPSVTENICINLDNYKSKVKSFILQIENCTFTPIGVNQYGIIFKVTGNILPQEITEGTYYILDENSELVTKGKYKYSS